MAAKLKVFLSSTAKDMTAFRKAVHARLIASPLFECIRQEEFFALPNPPVEVCREQVMRADLLIGLIGMRRGWEPAEKNPDQRSITELEYEWAKDIAPRFMHVTTEDFPVPGNLRESNEHHQRHLAFRSRLGTELTISQAGFLSPDGLPVPDEFARLVVDQLTNYSLERGLVLRKQPDRAADSDLLEGLSDAVAQRVLRLLDERELKKAERRGLEPEAVLKLARPQNPDQALDFRHQIAELKSGLSIALDAIERGRRKDNDDVLVDRVQKAIAAHTRAGQNDLAARAVDDALSELDKREQEQREMITRSRLTLLEEGIAQDILRRDVPGVIRRVDQSLNIKHPSNPNEFFKALLGRQDEFYSDGRDKGINLSLEIAIALARHSVDIAHGPDQRGSGLNDLGLALWALGERESRNTRLEEAIVTFDEALKERTRENATRDWAVTQNNLGNALSALAEREPGEARLKKAVAAYRDALSVFTPEISGPQWAMTQNNLGSTLQVLGERENSAERLREAVDAFRAALTMQNSNTVPTDWAMTQNNLGAALKTLGEHEGDPTLIKDAIEAFREALKKQKRRTMPVAWAATQNNLGAAFKTLGEHEKGSARFEQALKAYDKALTIRTRERGALDWAATTGNRGEALALLADRRRDGAMASAAVTEIERAIAALREVNHLPYLEYFEKQLTMATAIRDKLNGA